ncbi:MAG: AMP-binding protein, partial [Bdellovibrionales bacterium]|nr:AMP-binding protein [Bdellovibrionales bacterium]
MNSLRLLLDRDPSPRKMAFFPLDGSPSDFGSLMDRAVRAQKSLRSFGFRSGSSLLLADSISAEFYAVVMAALGLGGKVILVEPFLPVSEIESVILRMKPSVFVSSLLGRLWGGRVRAIRSIPHWRSSRGLCSESTASQDLAVEQVAPDDPAIITFTSGTTKGRSKGVVRTHRILSAQNHEIRKCAGLDSFQGPDLAIFANLTLANLGMGRGTIFIPTGWKPTHLRMIRDLPRDLAPRTLSCGPAFLEKFISSGFAPKTLESVHVGGALTECSVFERAFRTLPSARFLHVYGSSEVEPVAFVDARESVVKSRDQGYLHALLAGPILSSLRDRLDERTLWVSGEHVCGEYLGNLEENQKSKFRDEAGNLWHAMGDRMKQTKDGLWYQGRSFQIPGDFELEQSVYRFLEHTHA